MDGHSLNGARRIALLAGGDSAEREISLASGEQAAAALSVAGYQPLSFDPAEIKLDAIDWSLFDVCFIALHGGAGEDGRIQAELEQLGVPYTGSDARSSRLAMNKSAAKKRFLSCGVQTLPFVALEASEFRTNESIAALATLGYPLIIKPESQGSSFGVCVAYGPNDLQRCLATATQFDQRVLVEPFTCGREFTVSLLGRDPLPLIEIVAPQQFFSYDAKYANGTTEFRFDAGLPNHIETQVQRAAVAAGEALGTAGLVRVDLILDHQNRPWVLEVNTIPGLTARSLAPRAAQAAGMEFPILVDWMIRDALARSTAADLQGIQA
jgi:D-alanine-D-alanine ligase